MRLRATTHRAVGLTAAVTLTLGLSACDGLGSDLTSPTTSRPPTTLARSDSAGGTITAMSLGPMSSLDPQRMASRADISFASRVYARTLTTFPAAPDAAGQLQLTGDLATDTGTASKDLRTWTFTLRDGVAWQDGSAVTCEDVKYGISRTFATKDVTGGPAYALVLLDIPKQPDGTSTYDGPYATGKDSRAGAASFDKAVRCSGPKITFRLAAPTADFNEVLTLPAFGPYKQERDKGKDGTYAVFSSGPYMLREEWKPSVGGTFVRNPSWTAASDPVRKALPDQIDYQEGVETQSVVQRIMADGSDGASAVAMGSAPPAMQQQIAAAADLQGRTINPDSGLVDYLALNVRKGVFTKEKVRQALAVSTNRAAYVTALGGDTVATPSRSLIPEAIAAAETTDTLGSGTTGDPVRAAALLKEAKVSAPVRITVAYRASQSADKAMAALAAGWTQAGFEPELKPIEKDYFTAVAEPGQVDTDVFWSNWAPEWPSAATVLAPLFDSRLNLTSVGTGRDYGYFSDKKVNAAMTRLASVPGRDEREKGWADIDAQLTESGVYIALVQRRSMFVAGSKVRNFSSNEVAGGYVEWADIAVE